MLNCVIDSQKSGMVRACNVMELYSLFVLAGAFICGVPVRYSKTDSATGKWKMAKVASDSIISSSSTVTKRGLPKTESSSYEL